MRKYILIIGLLAFLFGTPQVCLGADALTRMLHADEYESFRQDQDALIVGKLTERQGSAYEVKVLKILSGKVISDTIKVSDTFTYGWGKEEPKVDHFCLLSIKREGSLYKKAWGIFKADSGDFKTLKLDSINAPTPGLLGDLACIEWYANSDGKESDFYFIGNTAFVKRPNGQNIKLYPKIDQPKETPAKSSQLVQTRENPMELGLDKKLIPYILVALLTAIGVIITALKWWRTRK